MGEWPKKHKLVGDERGFGLMIGVELVKNRATKERAPEERDRVVELAFERGVLFLGSGANSIRVAPPLITSKEQADIAMDVLEECLEIAAK
jgi:4-aminobutyrate aminotransferase